MGRLNGQPKLYISENNIVIEQVSNSLANTRTKTIGPEIIFDRKYNSIVINEELFRHLAIARLASSL